jgi:hypothetical protein
MKMLAKLGYVGIFICIHSDIPGGPSAEPTDCDRSLRRAASCHRKGGKRWKSFRKF